MPTIALKAARVLLFVAMLVLDTLAAAVEFAVRSTDAALDGLARVDDAIRDKLRR